MKKNDLILLSQMSNAGRMYVERSGGTDGVAGERGAGGGGDVADAAQLGTKF